MRQFVAAFTLVLALSWVATADAHHSRSNFLLDQTVEISGKVTEFSFRSPHAWITIETRGADGGVVAYTIEGGSVGSLRRFGWDKDSLQVGDLVSVIGNPDRKPENRLLYLSSVQKADGTRLVVTGEPVVAAGDTAQAVMPSTDFSGIWMRVASEDYFNVGAFEPPTHWPLNDRGRAQVARFDMKDDPMVKCIPPALPRLSYSPFRHRWTRDGDVLITEKELSPFKRRIELGSKEFPTDIAPTRMGHSIGWIDDEGALVIETRGFVADPWGNYRGLDSSPQKSVRERYILADDGLSMQLELTVTDPDYLTAPYTEQWKFVKAPDFDGSLAGLDCDPESARRHLEFD